MHLIRFLRLGRPSTIFHVLFFDARLIGCLDSIDIPSDLTLSSAKSGNGQPHHIVHLITRHYLHDTFCGHVDSFNDVSCTTKGSKHFTLISKRILHLLST